MRKVTGMLACDCGSELFSRVLKLSVGQGLVETPAGYRCNACLAVVDAAYLTARQEAVAMRLEAQRLAEQADAMAPPPAPPRPVQPTIPPPVPSGTR